VKKKQVFHLLGECLPDFTRAFPQTPLGDFHHKTSYPGPTTLQKLTTSPASAHQLISVH